MSPEYAMEGRYSTKSDVFSYGVLLLEIIAGQRNRHCETGRGSPNLIGHVSYNRVSHKINNNLTVQDVLNRFLCCEFVGMDTVDRRKSLGHS